MTETQESTPVGYPARYITLNDSGDAIFSTSTAMAYRISRAALPGVVAVLDRLGVPRASNPTPNQLLHALAEAVNNPPVTTPATTETMVSKAAVREVARRYAEAENWCSVVQDCLFDMGVYWTAEEDHNHEPEVALSLVIEVAERYGVKHGNLPTVRRALVELGAPPAVVPEPVQFDVTLRVNYRFCGEVDSEHVEEYERNPRDFITRRVELPDLELSYNSGVTLTENYDEVSPTELVVSRIGRVR